MSADNPSMPAARATDAAITPRSVLLWVWRHLRVGALISVGVAGFLNLVYRAPFGVTLVYSLCIGLTITFLIELGRVGAGTWWPRRRSGGDSRAREWPGWGFMAPWVLASAMVGYAIGSLLGDALTGLPRTASTFGGNPRSVALVLLVSVGVSLGITWFFYTRGRLASAQAQAEAARRTALENQLKLMRSQLEPHMLFNTLANLRVLIGLDAARAQDMLDHLIAFLRSTLAASRLEQRPLADEFSHLADYLALMAIRMGPRLQVAFDLPAELASAPVPPLLLQPLVENAVRHGLEPQVAGGRIGVQARRDGARLWLTVRDTGAGLPAVHGQAPVAADGGFGTAQVRERLAVLYGAQAGLTLAPADDGEGGTLAEVWLPVAGPIRAPA